jgi:hypothetical protein
MKYQEKMGVFLHKLIESKKWSKQTKKQVGEIKGKKQNTLFKR